MNRRYRTWIPVIVFWTLFLASLGLGKGYPWLDTVWYVAGMLFLMVVSVSAVVHLFRHHDEIGGGVGYRGVPR